LDHCSGIHTLIPALTFAQVGAMAIFDQWLDKHADVRSDLTKNPNLINDPAYLRDHPNLKAYLDQHPQTRDQLRENPSAFMRAEQSYEASENSAAPQGAIEIFDHWLDTHSDVRADLYNNPNLINDPVYLRDHPNLKAYLDQHPITKQQLSANPSAFMQAEKAHESSENPGAPKDDITKSELRNWNDYLDKHEDVRDDLTKNPNLIDDPAYLQKRPHLREFLEDHPNTRRELKENPKLFMSREQDYDKHEDKK
jgi:hypothetical protein